MFSKILWRWWSIGGGLIDLFFQNVHPEKIGEDDFQFDGSHIFQDGLKLNHQPVVFFPGFFVDSLFLGGAAAAPIVRLCKEKTFGKSRDLAFLS